jgi:hypothetical protein
MPVFASRPAPRAPEPPTLVTCGFGGAKIDRNKDNGISIANGARWKRITFLAILVFDGFNEIDSLVALDSTAE